MTGPMSREEAQAATERAGQCGAQSKLSMRGDPRSFFVCTNNPGHWLDAHTACDSHGHVLARWMSKTSVIEVWLPDGYHIV